MNIKNDILNDLCCFDSVLKLCESFFFVTESFLNDKCDEIIEKIYDK